MNKTALAGACIGLACATAVLAQTVTGADTAAPAAAESPADPASLPKGSITDPNTGTMVVSEDGRDFLTSKLVGAKVVGKGNEELGEVADLMLAANGNLRAVVIGVGGVMGVGTRYVAVSPGSIRMSYTRSARVLVVLNATPEQIGAAPEFQYEKKS